MRKKGAELVFLGELPGEEVIDFYHAAGHLDTALAYGEPIRSAVSRNNLHKAHYRWYAALKEQGLPITDCF